MLIDCYVSKTYLIDPFDFLLRKTIKKSRASKSSLSEDPAAVAATGETGEDGEPVVRRRKKVVEKPQAKPMIMVRLQLQADKIVFLPDLGETSRRKGMFAAFLLTSTVPPQTQQRSM